MNSSPNEDALQIIHIGGSVGRCRANDDTYSMNDTN